MQKTGAILAFFVIGAVAAPILGVSPLGRVGGAGATLVLGLFGALLARYAGPRGLDPSIPIAGVATLIGFMHAARAPIEEARPTENLVATRIAGTVVNVRESTRGGAALVDLGAAFVVVDGTQSPDIRVRWPRGSEPPVVGDLVQAFGMLEVTPRGPILDPVVFGNVIVSPTIASRLRRSVEGIRRELAARADRTLSPLGADLTVSLCLGIDRDADQWRDHLARAGALHFFAVSGFQLAVLLVFLRRLTAPIASMPRLRVVCLSIALVAYTAISGGEAPVLRALLMGLVLFAARLLRRPFHAGYALIVAAALQIACDPRTAGDVGFLLSMSAMAGLIWLVPPLSERQKTDVIGRFLDKKLRRPLAKYLEKNAIATIAAVLVTSPIAVGMFGVFHVAGLVGNLLLVPLVGGHFIVGLFLLAGVPCGPIVDLLASAIHQIVLWISDRPGTAYPTHPPFFFAFLHTITVATTVLLAARIGDRRARPFIALPIASLILCIVWPTSSAAPRIATQGDDAAFAVAILDGSSAMVFLTGQKDARIERSFVNRLNREGMRRIEILVQLDADPVDRSWRRNAFLPEVDLHISDDGATELVVDGKSLNASAAGTILTAGPFRLRTDAAPAPTERTRSLIVELGGQAIVFGVGPTDHLRDLARSRGARTIILWRSKAADDLASGTDDDVVVLAPSSSAAARSRTREHARGIEIVERRFSIRDIDETKSAPADDD